MEYRPQGGPGGPRVVGLGWDLRLNLMIGRQGWQDSHAPQGSTLR